MAVRCAPLEFEASLYWASAGSGALAGEKDPVVLLGCFGVFYYLLKILARAFSGLGSYVIKMLPSFAQC